MESLSVTPATLSPPHTHTHSAEMFQPRWSLSKGILTGASQCCEPVLFPVARPWPECHQPTATLFPQPSFLGEGSSVLTSTLASCRRTNPLTTVLSRFIKSISQTDIDPLAALVQSTEEWSLDFFFYSSG